MNVPQKPNDYSAYPDGAGRFGDYGGRYVPETLMPLVLELERAYDGLVDHLMFETKPPLDAERPGGLGQAFDWSLISGRRFERPHFLAGGLDPWNVAEAIRASGAPMVDVSSGVERGAGLKDPGLISAFLDATRRA